MDDKPFANIRRRDVASATPYYRDLAPDVVVMAQRIRDLLGQAKTVAETPVTFEAPASRDSSSQTPRFEPEFNLTDLDDTF